MGDELGPHEVDRRRRVSFTRFPDSHVDHHDIWINPEDTDVMINGNDGGASVTFNGGRTWSTLMNQPTAQMYRVFTDNLFPYKVYSGQQDASGIVTESRTLGSGIGEHHWQTIRSGESATVGLDPENPRFVYSTFFASFLGEWDAETRNYRMVRPYPERVTGEQPRNLKYRANWNGPVYVSTHDPDVIYYGSQYLMKSTDRGNNVGSPERGPYAQRGREAGDGRLPDLERADHGGELQQRLQHRGVAHRGGRSSGSAPTMASCT